MTLVEIESKRAEAPHGRGASASFRYLQDVIRDGFRYAFRQLYSCGAAHSADA